MKKTMALLLAMMLVLSCLGTVVLAADAPVITGGYIGGNPVVGEYVYAIVDGTYGGVAFEQAKTGSAYSVTASYAWEYGEGENWTAITNNGFPGTTRVCKVTNDMVGKYIRCIVTPTDGTTQGAAKTFVFPTKVMVAADAKWKETTLFLEEFSGANGSVPNSISYGSDKADFGIENGAWKMSNWTKLGTYWTASTEEGAGQYDGTYKGTRISLFSLKSNPILRPGKTYTFSWDYWSDAGRANHFQLLVENYTNLAITGKTDIQAFRGGEYDAETKPTATKATRTISIPMIQVLSSGYAKPDDKTGIMTSAMQLANGAGRSFGLTIPDNGTVFSGGITAVYLDNLKVTERSMLYDVTVTDGTQVMDTIEVEAGATREIVLPKPAGKIITAVTVNGEDAEVTNGMITLNRVYQDYEVEVTYSDIEIDHISLENNKVYYIGADRAEETLNVTAYDADGNSSDITGIDGIILTSSDSSVFVVNGNKVKSTGKTGKAVITATYNDMKASVIMTREPASYAGTGNVTGQSFPVLQEANIDSKYKVVDGFPGHNDNTVFTPGETYIATESHMMWGFYFLRLYVGRVNWYDRGIRTVSGWFYDDGVNPVGYSSEIGDSVSYNGAKINEDMAEDMSYGQFDWTGVKSWTAPTFSIKAELNAAQYVYPGGKIDRTTGWHQVMCEIVKDPTSATGWSFNSYLDGQLIISNDLVKNMTGDSEPHFELRATCTQSQTKTPIAGSSNYTYYFYPTYFDDMIMGGSLVSDIVGINTDIVGNGTVTIEGATKGGSGWNYVNAGDVTVSLNAGSDSELRSVSYNGTALTPEDGKVVLKNVTADGTLNVEFGAATVDPAKIDRISLENNVVNYVGTDRAESTIKLTAYDKDNKAFDITGLDGVTYTSSNPAVFTVNGNKVKSNGVNGQAIITAKYGDKTASVMMLRYPTALNGTDEFEGKTYPVMVEASINGTTKDTTVPGHDGDGESWTWGTSVAASTWKTSWNFRLYVGRNNWYDRGYRSATGWFYDDGVNPIELLMENFMPIDSAYKDGDLVAANADLAEDLGYGEFGDKLKNVMILQGTSRFIANLNAEEYQLTETATGTVNVASRTVGWHQVTWSLAKDPGTQLGWSYKVYLDGVEVGRVPVKNSTNASQKDPHFELRGVPKAKDASSDPVIIYPFRIDDIVLGGNLEKDVFGVKLQLTGNGTATVNGTAFENDKWTYVAEGDSVDVTLAPGSNDKIESVTLDGKELTPNASNIVTLENLTKDSVLAVTYAEKPPVSADIAEDTAYSWFKTVEGIPTIYAYSKLNDFNVGENLQYGMKLWIKGDADNFVLLPVRDAETGEISTATAGAAFAVRAFGEAITSDKTYVMVPYVGTVTGDELETEHTNQ